MKILIYFADMVAGQMVKAKTNKAIPTSLESVLQDMGGVTFINCFSPAPDTPRSLSTIFTGLMPNVNGCNRRDKWPGYDLDVTSPSIFRTAIDSGFRVSALLSTTEIKTKRFLPRDCSDEVRVYSNLEELVQALKCDSASPEVTFIQDNDCHFAISDHFGLRAGHTIGTRRVGKNLQRLLHHTGRDYFDSIVVFSDHGFAPSLPIGRRNRLESSGPQRSRVLFHFWSKELECPKTSTRLTTTADVGILLQSMIQTRSAETAIYSLLSRPANETIIVEDYSNHRTSFGVFPDVWSVITPNLIYIESSDGHFSALTQSIGVNNEIQISRTDVTSAEASHFREILRDECESFQNSQEMRSRLGADLTIKTYMDSSSRTTGTRAILRIVGTWLDSLRARIPRTRENG